VTATRPDLDLVRDVRRVLEEQSEWVRAEVARYGDRLSGLSRREATRHLR
jgi:hypothetical protein